MVSLINGQQHTVVDVTDRALHYGDGLFTTLAVKSGQPIYWQRHIDRLNLGCERLRLPCPDPDQLRAEAMQIIGSAQQAILKLILTRGQGGQGYQLPDTTNPTRIMLCYPWPKDILDKRNQGIVLTLCHTRLAQDAQLGQIKHLNRLPHVLARAEWTDPTISEGLMCNQAGCVIEGTKSNVFWVKQQQLYTPDIAQCGVAGVMRSVILEVAREQNIPIQESLVTPEVLQQADELFISNSIMGIWPVKQFGTTTYSKGTITGQLIHKIFQNEDKYHA